MNTVLVALNAKYIHSSLPLRALKANCGINTEIKILELTINNTTESIIKKIYLSSPDVIGFSCYIWNIEKTLEVISNIRLLLPKVKIILGGPEASFDYENLLKNYSIDVIVVGEGEEIFNELIKNIKLELNFENIPGIAFLKGEKVTLVKKNPAVDMNNLVFAYDNGIEELEDKIIYYESSRGCPFNCSYCLSALENELRFLNLDRCLKELQFFLDKKVPQVKFVDRTFNSDENRAITIWNYLKLNDNGITNFHFEMDATLISDNTLDVLKDARAGLFQFEIGVQSTNEDTLKEVHRLNNFEHISYCVSKIRSYRNINIHLDIIAGLPYEDFDSFSKSFNDVFNLRPDMLQLGFLKLLKGSDLRNRAENFGIVYADYAPYEFLYTKHLSFVEVIHLKEIEEVLEIYYNSGRLRYSLPYILNLFESPFHFFSSLADFWNEHGYFEVKHKNVDYYNFIYEFLISKGMDIALVHDILILDIFSKENIRTFPYWYRDDLLEEEKTGIKNYLRENYYNGSRMNRDVYIYKFNYDVTNINSVKDFKPIKCYILFNYRKRNFDGCYNFTKIELEF